MRIGISIGDTNGIGLEVIMKTFADHRILEFCTPVIYASTKVVAHHKRVLNIQEFNYTGVKDASQALAKKVNLIHCWEEEVEVKFGEQNETGGKYALKSLDAAIADLQAGNIHALVTAPLSKHNIAIDGFTGHTGYLAKAFEINNYLMFLVSPILKVALATEHVPLAQVKSQLSPEKIFDKLNLLHLSLLNDFGVDKPKIAVLGLNPHAGDGGSIGNEEKELILPGIAKAKAKGMMVYGCYPADGFFANRSYYKFDAVLALYHDQGLIPFKSIAFADGVNFTAGLPVVRTSPDHGTAFDIAGKNLADESSFRNSVYAAIDILRTRSDQKEITSNPLPYSQQRRERFRMDF